MKRTLIYVGTLALLIVGALTIIATPAEQGVSLLNTANAEVDVVVLWPKELTGWAWSDNVGWISLNCSNTGSCVTSNYKVEVLQNGNLQGYAWSDSVGWISFTGSDTTLCPGGSCQANVNLTSGGPLLGYARAVVHADKNAGDGEWNGWLSLNLVSYNAVTGKFSGYLWGGLFGFPVPDAVVGLEAGCPTCVQKQVCGGSYPSSGTVAGASTYSSGYTPNVWTRLDTGSLGSCQWRCDIASGYQLIGGTCQIPSCGGSVPANAIPSSASPNGSTWTYNSVASDACQFKCASGHTWDGSMCRADVITGACTGPVPENAAMCSAIPGSGVRTLTGERGGTGNSSCPADSATVPNCSYYCPDGLKRKNNKCLTGLQYLQEQ